MLTMASIFLGSGFTPSLLRMIVFALEPSLFYLSGEPEEISRPVSEKDLGK